MRFGSAGSVVGLELDVGEARVVELRGSVQNPVFIAGGRIDLPDGAVEEGMVVHPDAVGSSLAELWRKSGIGSREVVVGVSNQGVLVRFAAFPEVPRDKLDNVVRFQAQDHLPVPLDNVVLDYAVVGEIKNEAGAQVEVMLVAARRDMLGRFLAALSAAHLKPRDIDVASLALLRMRPASNRSEVTALVNIANGLSNILVTAAGVPRLVRLMSANLQEAAEMLGGRQVGLPLHRVVPGGGAAGKQQQQLPEALLPWVENLAGEIRSSTGYYQTQAGAAVERVLLSGQGARIDGLIAQLQESLGIPVGIIQPLDGIDISAVADAGIKHAAPDFTVSIGLARRELEA